MNRRTDGDGRECTCPEETHFSRINVSAPNRSELHQLCYMLPQVRLVYAPSSPYSLLSSHSAVDLRSMCVPVCMGHVPCVLSSLWYSVRIPGAVAHIEIEDRVNK